jgi:hypothetical protein
MKLVVKIDTAQNDAARGALELSGAKFTKRALFNPIAQSQELFSRWVGAVRATRSKLSSAAVLTAHGTSLLPSIIENKTTIRSNSYLSKLPRSSAI